MDAGTLRSPFDFMLGRHKGACYTNGILERILSRPCLRDFGFPFSVKSAHAAGAEHQWFFQVSFFYMPFFRSVSSFTAYRGAVAEETPYYSFFR